MAASEYLMVIAMVTIAVVGGAYLLVAFYREVLVPTMAGQVQNAVQTGMTADQRRQ